MPTTILDGETYEQAKHRRFKEEAEIDARIAGTTLCWNCNTVYPIIDRSCPKCNSFNANIHPEDLGVKQ